MIILDLDNCIADDGWRIPKIDWEHENPDVRYWRYHSLAPFDTAGNHDLLDRAREEGCVISTARPAHYKCATVEWLKRIAGLQPLAILMREPYDHRPSVHLKRSHVEIVRGTSSYEKITAAFDDRPDVVQMYRMNGIVAEVRSIHDLCAYTRPQEKT